MGSSVGKIIGGIALAIVAPEAIGAIAGMAADATSVAIGTSADLGLDAVDAADELPTVQPLDPITQTVTPTDGVPTTDAPTDTAPNTSTPGENPTATASPQMVPPNYTPAVPPQVVDAAANSTVTGQVGTYPGTPGTGTSAGYDAQGAQDALNQYRAQYPDATGSGAEVNPPGSLGKISNLITNPGVVDGALKAGGSVLSGYLQGQAMLQGKQFDANQAALKIQRNAAALAQAQRLVGTGGPNPSTLNSGYVTPAAQNALPNGVLGTSNANLNPYTGS